MTERFIANLSDNQVRESDLKETNRESINKSRVVTRDCIEKAVKKIEFGKVNSRTNLYMREEITGSKTKSNSSLNKR